MHKLKILDGRVYLDEMKLCGVKEYSIAVSEAGCVYPCELSIKLVVNLKGINEKESDSDKAARICEKISEGKISINQARKEYGLKPIEDGDFTAIEEKKLVTMNEEKNLIELIIRYAKRHNFTVSNIMGAVQKVREYMANNAVVISEDCNQDEMQSSED